MVPVEAPHFRIGDGGERGGGGNRRAGDCGEAGAGDDGGKPKAAAQVPDERIGRAK
jgi:hypothetical protein